VTVIAHELRGFLPVGGMGTATTFLTLALARIGHDVEILLGSHSPDSIDPFWQSVYSQAGVRIRPAPAAGERVEPWQFMHPRWIELALRADPPDVVIAHDFGAPAYTALRLRQAGVAFENSLFIVFCHGTRAYLLDLSANVNLPDLRHVLGVGVLEQAAIELADVVVSPSAYLVDWMREQQWQLPERTLVIPHFTGADTAGEPTAAARGDGGSIQRLAFFGGRVDEKKGLRPFAEALNALEPELLERLELEFVGRTTPSWPPDRVERLLSEPTRRALRRVTFESDLDQHQALERLRRPGTLAVMPSLLENSPNTVYECLEHGIPFIASDVGGVAELIAPEDRSRVLFAPTPEGVSAALRRALADGHVLRPARPAFSNTASAEAWADVIQMRPHPRSYRTDAAVDVVVVHRASRDALERCLAALERQRTAPASVTVAEVGVGASSVEAAREQALRAGSAPFVVFLDEEDEPDPELLSTLLRAQAASGADAVTCGLRVTTEAGESTLHFFSGEAGGLGALANAYGSAPLLRRSALRDLSGAWPAERDADWPLLAGLAVAGARIVSVPTPLVTRRTAPGSVDRDPSDALLVVDRLERALPEPLQGAARVVAGVAADAPRSAPEARPSLVRRLARRAFGTS
jgi:glycosyltransferase involved in cell wall biosynthesis